MSSESLAASVIITVKNNGIDLYTTMESLKVSHTELPYEVIIIDENSVDGCCDFLINYRFDRPIKLYKGEPGITARNIGAAHASGSYLIFCGAHLYYDDGWVESLLGPIMNGTADCTSPSFQNHERSVTRPKEDRAEGLLKSIQNYPEAKEAGDIPWLSWECFAIGRDKFHEIGGFEDAFISKELETAEFSLRMWLLGGICRFVPDVSLTRVFRLNFPYDDSSERWGGDLLTMAHLHLNEQRIEDCRQIVLDVFGQDRLCDSRLSEAIDLARCKYASRRQNDDTWFIERFGIGV